MKTIKVEKTHSKKIEYNDKKTGEPKSFMKYAALFESIWYEIKGKGNDQFKEGDTLVGEYAEQDWESGGKSGTNYFITLLDKTIADILERIEDLETSVTSLLINQNMIPDEKPEVKDNDDLPF